ncbi:MAG TPA: PP2C family protein-serine/threonine phosphatase [Solirubrobacteraceae bacterium]|nr:PP2C family protein-serine/threonine phosphatase [Solirubrobacteraceae bacterium]
MTTRRPPGGQPPGARRPEWSALPPPIETRSVRGWRPSRVATVAFFLGLLVTAAFALISLQLYDRNEGRLLRLRAREVGSVLTAVVPSIQTPLASAAELADATGGNASRFRAFMAPYVGAGRQFASASLWRLGAPRLAPTAVVGTAPVLAKLPDQARSFFAHAEHSQRLNITGILAAPRPSLGFEFSTPGVTHGFAVYAENPLPKDRRSTLARNSAFSDLNYALYLGHSRRRADLLVTSLHRFPVKGRQASTVAPFGDSAFTLIVTPNGPLGGTFFASLPWIIVGVGVVISLAAGLMTDRLARRRQQAEQLSGVLDRVAAENHELYTEQRGIAQTLQHALLPDALPRFAGLQVSARYIPAASGIDVGGDWYDVVAAGEGRALLVIGDVSGHGLHSATTMALLRHAALAYAAEDSQPAAVLAKLSDFVNSDEHDYFATVLCALIDVEAHSLTIASAGHIAPLLIDGERGEFVKFEVNVPIGVMRDEGYEESVVPVPPNATLVAFTDGLVERRSEVLDTGLARLRETAIGRQLGPDDLVETLTSDLASKDHNDDTAIVVIQWES